MRVGAQTVPHPEPTASNVEATKTPATMYALSLGCGPRFTGVAVLTTATGPRRQRTPHAPLTVEWHAAKCPSLDTPLRAGMWPTIVHRTGDIEAVSRLTVRISERVSNAEAAS